MKSMTKKCPSIDNCIQNTCYRYTVEYYLAIRKDELLPFSTRWMDLEDIMLSKISQSEKAKNQMTSLIYRI